ncbi:MAG TPA: SIS domain-containing protein [Actinomycetota bacterium]
MTWSPDPAAFLADLEAKPAFLRALADRLEAADPWAPSIATPPERVVLFGMGSSRFAALLPASRMRASRTAAWAGFASGDVSAFAGPGTLAVGISASGGTAETVEALADHRARGSTTVALTNDPSSALAVAADHVVEMAAGEERGGVACRTFQHTLALLLELAASLGAEPGRAGVIRAAADATEHLLDARDTWLPEAAELLTETGRTFLIAPEPRLASAAQGALMLREGPRVHADACETGDWLHVDVYLTKPLDYRALLFAGSRFSAEVLRWCAERGSTVVAVGDVDTGSPRRTIRFPGDHDETIAALAEVLVPELVAARVWASQ